MSDTDRVLKMLRERGLRGLNPSDVLSGLPDGGKPIQRLAARVRELRAAGWGIESCRQSNGTSTYRLVSEPEERREHVAPSAHAEPGIGNPADEPSHAASGQSESLFEVPPVGKPGWADVESAA